MRARRIRTQVHIRRAAFLLLTFFIVIALRYGWLQIVQGDAVKATPIPGKTGQAGQVPLALHTGSTSPIPLPNVPNPSRIFAAPTPVVQPPTIQPQQAPVILQPRAPMQEAPKAAEVKKTDSTKIAYFGDEETPR